MSKLLERHWQTILLVGTALVIFYLEHQAVPDYKRWLPRSFDNPFFVAMGKWAIRFLLISLAITPLYSITGWRFPIRLRKPAGLLAFMFVSIHVGIYLVDAGNYTDELTLFERLTQPWYLIFGVTAYTVLLSMALTSFKLTTKLMGRYWKPLHRLVYLAGILIMVHSISAALYGKRGFLGGPQSAVELSLYAVILVLLLLARIPRVKNWLRRISPFTGHPGRLSRKRPLTT